METARYIIAGIFTILLFVIIVAILRARTEGDAIFAGIGIFVCLLIISIVMYNPDCQPHYPTATSFLKGLTSDSFCDGP